jgi:copper chaperone CopZ
MAITKFKITNLACRACAKIARREIKKISGIADVKINSVTGEGEIMADRKLTLAEIISALTGTGYQVESE